MIFLKSLFANRTKCSTFKKLLWTFYLLTLWWPYTVASNIPQLPQINFVYYLDHHASRDASNDVVDVKSIATISNNDNNVPLLFENTKEKNILKIIGENFPYNYDDIIVKLTDSDKKCVNTSKPLVIIYRNDTVLLAYDDSDLYFGQNSTQAAATYLCFFEKNNFNYTHMGMKSKFMRQQRSVRVSREVRDTSFKNSTLSSSEDIRIYGMRIENSDKHVSFTDDGVPELMSETKVTLRLFGDGFKSNTLVTLTEERNDYGDSCLLPTSGQFKVKNDSVVSNTVLVDILMPKGSTYFYLCAKNAEKNVTAHKFNDAKPFMHQGSDDWLRMKSYESILPIWAAILIISCCLMFSALFSGLNLGLMSLDRTELKILKNTGTGKERAYAAKIQPIRDHGNYLLCSILLGNVLVNSTFTILLDSLTSGLVAIICSTLLIVVFGEITPQAICSRHGLAVGANTIFITKCVMVLTFPLAYPTSKFLDYLLGEEIGNVYNRERLKELVRVTKDVNDLDKDEVNIISGALELRKKQVGAIMTHIEDAFMLSYDAILDFDTISEIMKSGFSRIPVFEEDRKNVIAMLFIKDLAFVDPDDNTPLRTLCEYYQNPCHFIFEDVTLDVMFKQFKEGQKGHMAFVHRVNSEGDGDPFYETVGLVTLEDVIEELIQAEIMDETDVYTDNRTKVRRDRTQKQDFTLFAERRDVHRLRISPQLTLATFQYLTTSVDAFKPDIISETILRRLLNQDVVHNIKCKGKDKNDPSMFIYQQGKPADFFVLILEGRVEVQVGRENLMFESGPFTYFGIQALVQNVGVVDSPIQGSIQSLNMDALLRHTFVPDYSVKAVTEVFYISVKRTLYLAAKRATLMERSQKTGEMGSNEPIDDEVEKLLNSLDEDDRSINTHTANLNANTPRTSKPSSNTPSPINADAIQNGPSQATINVHSFQVSSQLPGRSQSIPNQSTRHKLNIDDSVESPLLAQIKY